MIRLQTELEKKERWRDEAKRLRGALFAASLADTLEEAKRICHCAMRGELHGHEIPDDNKFNPTAESYRDRTDALNSW